MGNLNARVKADSDVFPERMDVFPEEKITSNNPGTVEEMLKKCKGARLALQRPVSNHLQIAQTLTLSSLTPAGYKLSATYVGNEQYGPNEVYPVLVGEIDPSANLNARMFFRPFNRLIARFDAQVQQGSFASNATLDYKGDDYSASLTTVHPDLISCSGVLVAQYLQKFYKNVDLGAEIIYQRSHHIPGGQAAFTSLCGKYTGMIDSNWNVGGTLEKSLSPMPYSLVVSGTLNHLKNQFRLGLGFTVG